MGCDKIVARKPLAISTDGGIVSLPAPYSYEMHSEKDTAQSSLPYWLCSKGLVHTTPHQKLKSLIGNSKIKTLLPEAFQFLVNDQPANFSLGFWT